MSPEAFYINPQTGQDDDKAIHGPILEGISPQDEQKLLLATIDRARRMHGMDDETLRALYCPEMSIQDFKQWLKTSDTTRPIGK